MTPFWCEVPRDVVLVQGADALTYLHSQLSQDIRPLQPGASCYSFVLEPAGKITALVRVTRTGEETFVLDLDAGFGAALIARLNRFKIRVKVEISAVPWRCIAVRGSTAPAPLGVPAWGSDDAFDLIGEDPQPPPGVAAATVADVELSRIRAGWPAQGREITEQSIPAETGIVDLAVNFTKGCYPGQELVERMDSRGSNAPRFVRMLSSRAELPADVTVSRDGQPVGTITSLAPDGDGWLALALVARSVHPGDTVTVDGASVVVQSARGR